jgi:Tfp pilus assembly ATPase PilU
MAPPEAERERTGMSGNMERVLRLMAEKNASDVYMSANTPILIKINGQILQLSDQMLTPHSRASCWPRC